MPSVGRQRGRHRAPTRFSNFITPYVLIALGLGAIIAIVWDAVDQFSTAPTVDSQDVVITISPPPSSLFPLTTSKVKTNSSVVKEPNSNDQQS